MKACPDCGQDLCECDELQDLAAEEARAAEIENEVREYLADVGDTPRDDWDVDTAAETPTAIDAPGPKKRSGEYKLDDLADEVAKKYASARDLLIELKLWLDSDMGQDPKGLILDSPVYWSTRIARRLARLDRS